jgi:hypothetical protein
MQKPGWALTSVVFRLQSSNWDCLKF